MVFDAAFLKRLEALRVAVRRVVGGPREGERPGIRRGGSSVFHSHRSYAQGDDFRAIDWNLYARFESLFVRERTRDEAPALHVVLDASPSMEFGTPTKLDLARRLGAALGFLVAGEGGDVTLWTGSKSRAFRGPGSVPGLLEAMAAEPGSGRPADSLARIGGRGLVVVASDFWDEGLDAAMSAAAGAGHPLTLLHLLAREEMDPAIRGRVRIADSEGGGAVTRFIADEEAARYRELLEEHVRGWRAWAVKREASYVRCASDAPFEEVCLIYLRGEGVLE
ncbi:MAG TPA: DUF58 domain-containing protein [Planctomycetota bacterium]|nr:DUF58 domain-containing protein [Planctomycetota bacterium]